MSLRPSLSSLVRSILLSESHEVLESSLAADEAVVVHPPQLKLSGQEGEAEREEDKTVKKAHAYVSTDKWRDSVVRTYTFLDKHADVGDVVVVPLAISRSAVQTMMPSGMRGVQGWVSDRRTAEAKLRDRGVDVPDAHGREDAITVVPLVGTIRHSPDGLPSAWNLVHGMFDRGMQDLPACYGVSRNLHKVLGPAVDPFLLMISPISLLLNCGWGENSFHMVSAALRRTGHRPGYTGVLDNMIGSPAIGRRYKGHEEVPIRDDGAPPSSSGSNYVRRSGVDIVSEIMTIAVVKPSGFQPVLDRMPQIPDDIMVNHIMHYHDNPHTEDLRARIWRQQESNRAARRLLSLDPADRKEIEEILLADLEEISMMTHDLRDRLVHDLLGKVVFVAAS